MSKFHQGNFGDSHHCYREEDHGELALPEAHHLYSELSREELELIVETAGQLKRTSSRTD